MKSAVAVIAVGLSSMGCGGSGGQYRRVGQLEAVGIGNVDRKITGLDLHSIVHESNTMHRCDESGGQHSKCFVEIFVPETIRKLLTEIANSVSNDMGSAKPESVYLYRTNFHTKTGFLQKIIIDKETSNCFSVLHISSYDAAPLTLGYSWLKKLKEFLARIPTKTFEEEFDKIPWENRVVRTDGFYLPYGGDPDTAVIPNVMWELKRCHSGENLDNGGNEFMGIVTYFINPKFLSDMEKILGF